MDSGEIGSTRSHSDVPAISGEIKTGAFLRHDPPHNVHLTDIIDLSKHWFKSASVFKIFFFVK